MQIFIQIDVILYIGIKFSKVVNYVVYFLKDSILIVKELGVRANLVQVIDFMLILSELGQGEFRDVVL